MNLFGLNNCPSENETLFLIIHNEARDRQNKNYEFSCQRANFFTQM